MKLRLFFILWISFLVSILGSTFLYTQLLRRERLQHVDEQLAALSSVILNSEIIQSGSEELIEVEEALKEDIGGYRLGLVLLVRNKAGKVIYKNRNADRLGWEPPPNLPWQMHEVRDSVIRVHTQPSENLNRVLQLGLVVNVKGTGSQFFDLFSAFGFLVVVISALVSFLLVTLLLLPLKRLAHHLSDISRYYDPEQLTARPLPQSIQKIKASPIGQFDELTYLIQSIEKVIEHVASASRLSRVHSAHLAHEINTPLTLMKNKVSMMPDSDEKRRIDKMIDQLAMFVRRYLEWQESIHKPLASTEIYAIRLNEFIREIEQQFDSDKSDRIKIDTSESCTVFAHPSDLEHVTVNLIQNALKYSQAPSPVSVKLTTQSLIISDEGPGISKAVLEKLGSAFNRSPSDVHGFGLGLSLVQLICQKYGWKFELRDLSPGTEATVVFCE